MRVWLLSSGSSGNLAVVEAEGHRVLVDAGLGPKRAVERMRELGGDLFAMPILGIFVTHHHGDHVAQAEPLARALRAPVFAHRGVSASRLRSRFEVKDYAPGRTLRLGPFEVDATWIPHDAPQVAVAVGAGSRRFAFATDLGHVTKGLVDLLGGCDAALVEANHCREMLATGPYPPKLKRRVSGGYGHLANDQTAGLVGTLKGTRLGRLWLGHLSRANNTPARALESVASSAGSIKVGVIPHGTPSRIDVGAASYQLSLPF